MAHISDCLGFMEQCVQMYGHNDVIILGDMNFACCCNNVGYKAFPSLCEELHVVRALSLHVALHTKIEMPYQHYYNNIRN